MKSIRRRRCARRSSLEAKLVAYSAMAGAALAVAPAQAADCLGGVVIGTACYTDIPDVTLTDDGTIPVDLDGDGLAELSARFHRQSWWVSSSLITFRASAQVVGEALSSVLGGFASGTRGPYGSLPAALLPGDDVGAPGLGAWVTREELFVWSTDVNGMWSTWGNWVGRQDRFAGIKVRLDGATTHFGWVRLSTARTSITLKDFAFNMVPEEPIPTSLDAFSEIFGDGFESGNTDAWSVSVP